MIDPRISTETPKPPAQTHPVVSALGWKQCVTPFNTTMGVAVTALIAFEMILAMAVHPIGM